MIIILLLNNNHKLLQHFTSFGDVGVISSYNRNYNVDSLRGELHPLQIIGMLKFLQAKYPPYSEVKTNKEINDSYYDYYFQKIKERLVNLMSKVACGMADDGDIEIVSRFTKRTRS